MSTDRTARVTTAAPPVAAGRWLRPAAVAHSAEPRWGHTDGLHVGIHPLPGPRGLLRVYTPYLDHPRDRLVNFIAVEPVVSGAAQRGLSELEPSRLDPGEDGKRMWATDAPGADGDRDPLQPRRGVVERIDGVETLTVWIGVEPFASGADVRVRMRFRADEPHEVELAGFATDASVALDRLVLTATMGNWSRLRVLELADRLVTPAELWPGFTGTGFATHAEFGLQEVRREGRAAVVSVVGDEEDPWSVAYADDTAPHWRFEGARARQSWRVDDPHPQLRASVNARWSYWSSASPIPGGPSFENVEIVEPFRQGAIFRFRVDPL